MNDSEGIKIISGTSGFEQGESQVRADGGTTALLILGAMAFYVLLKHSG